MCSSDLSVRDAFTRIADTAERLVAPQGGDVLTLQVYSTFTIRWLIPRLKAFEARHPQLKLRLVTSQWDVDFSRDDVDACIAIGHPNYTDLHYTYLFSSEVFPVASPAFLARHPLHLPEDLCRAPLLQVHPSRSDWQVWLDRAQVAGVDPDDGLAFDSYDHALATARQGLGVALAMEIYAADELASGALVEPFAPLRAAHPGAWWFVCRREQVTLPKVRALREWLLDEVTADDRLTRRPEASP